MAVNYRDKVIVVTGASSGIGRATAKAFDRLGAHLVLASRNESELQAFATELQRPALVQSTDVSDRAQVDALVKATEVLHGRIDVLINNAGIGLIASIEEMQLVQWRRVIAVNLEGAIHCIQAVLPLMKRQRSGQIVNISSILGKRAVPYMGVYSATKFALNGLSEALRVELADDGIDVILVCPGRTATHFQSNAMTVRPPLGPSGKGGMSAERCAAAIVLACARRRREVVLTREGILFVKIAEWFPSLMDRALLALRRRQLRRT